MYKVIERHGKSYSLFLIKSMVLLRPSSIDFGILIIILYLLMKHAFKGSIGFE